MTDATAPKTAKARAAAAKAKASLDQVVDKAAEAVGEARHWAEDRAAVGKVWAAERGDAVRGLVRERPVTTIGVSAAAAFLGGLLVGFLVARALDD
ncbi:MAG: hypothetical protein JWP92_69 [Caulobacter sp.]|nr:hypothetical protein [Caulobacter sp.]